MTPTFLERISDLENIAFFLVGVIVAGIASGVCAFFKERKRLKNTHYLLKD